MSAYRTNAKPDEPPTPARHCELCGGNITSRHARKFCSRSCTVRAQHRRRQEQEPMPTRFARFVSWDTGDCWEWTGRRNRQGYGEFMRDGRRRPGRRSELAHRVSYEITVGAIPDGLCVCHVCDNPACVRPDHLFLGTIADNNADMVQKGRHGMAKLAQEERDCIRSLVAGGSRVKSVARQFGISATHVYRICGRSV